MDGSIDIVMIDEAGEVFGSWEACGPIEPSGRVNRFMPFPEKLIETKTRDRFLARAGFEPNAVRDLSVETQSVDGRSGTLLRITIDLGDPHRSLPALAPRPRSGEADRQQLRGGFSSGAAT
jgi:hypothetical protein